MKTVFHLKGRFKYRKKYISLPVLLASCLFLWAVFSYIAFSASSWAQAARIVKKLFTSEQSGELEEAARIGLPQMYDNQFAGDLTKKGRDSLLPAGIPYTLYWQQFGAPVERIYAQTPELVQEETDSEETVSYRYMVVTEFYLEKRLEEVAPVVKKTFTGVITMQKTGFLKWKMDAFTTG